MLILMAHPAAAHSPFKVLLDSLDARIALAEAMEAEGKRQADERIAELRQWIGWWTSVQELAKSKQADLEKNIAERRKNAGLMLGLLRKLISDPKASRNLPGFGWQTIETATALSGSLALEARKLGEAVSAGKDTWHIVVLGWITGGAIQGQIDELEKQITQIQAGVKSGKFTFHGAFGWQTIEASRNEAQAARDELARVRDQISRGDYPLEIPGIGRITRNQLEAKMAELDKTIADLKETAGKGEMTIHRPAVGWVTRNKLQAMIDEGETAYKAMDAAIGQGLFTVHIAGAGGGWWSREKLQAQIAALDKQVADITAAIRAGDYKAQVLGGWASLNELKKYIEDREKRLADPNLAQLQRNQLAEQIEAAHKAITEWRDITAFDLAMKGFEKSRYLGFVASIAKLAKPEYEHRKLKRAEQVYHLSSFEGELALKLKPLESQRAAYQEALSWFGAP
ncbi:MAG: hypothetical protein D6754_00160 [Alphaproteobacteria bacterium]|nr:MAG: hypothetical protein D6754_00160 [Alphaproteobacteria bacterium]